jgi:ABC-2 type transport system permease protein
VDGSDPTILNIARQLLQTPAPRKVVDRAGADPLFELRNFYNPERRSAVQIVPALIGVILTMTMVLFTAVAIVRERERGNLELLITTPVRTPELMVGKLVPYILIGLVQVTIVLLVGHWLFDVPLRGQLLDVYLAALTFIAASLTLGLLISTLARSQFQAMQLTLFVFLPSILLSGFMFPFDGMPVVAQQIAEVLPLTHFVRLIRGIVLRGAELGELMPEIRALIVFFVVSLTLAILRFRKRLD